MPKVKYSYTLKDIYDNIDDPVVNYKEFRIVIERLMEESFNSILEGKVVALPSLFDVLFLVKAKGDNLLDHNGNVIDNTLTDDYYVTLKHRKSRRYHGSAIYRIVLSKRNREKIRDHLREDWTRVYNYPDV